MKPAAPGLDINTLFTMALGFVPPWEVTQLSFDQEAGRLDITADFQAGATLPCPKCGELCKVHDADTKTWRHLNFFQYVTTITVRTPRTKCEKDGVLQVNVPWARKGSNFTLLFESLVLELARNGLTVKAISRIVGENDTRLWRVLEHYVEEARAKEDYSAVKRIGLDETSRQKGHVYVTLFADMEASKIIYVTEGKDHETIARFKADLVAHGGDPKAITDISMDMSKAFIKGVRETFPKAEVTFDRFHVINLLNHAVDKTRRAEQKFHPELKQTRYDWLSNEENVKDANKVRFECLRRTSLLTARAYHLKTVFQEMYEQPAHKAAPWFARWYYWATHSRIEPMIAVAKTLMASLPGIMRWFESGLTNGYLEGANSLVQAAKARARGFQSFRKMMVVIYLLLSKLDFDLPNPLPSSTHSS